MKILGFKILSGTLSFLMAACSPFSDSTSTETRDLVAQERPQWTFPQTEGEWSYQYTYDKSTRLGRSPDALSIARDGTTAYFLIPKGLRVQSCADGPLNWHFAGYSDEKDFSFGVSLHEWTSDYEGYLAGIHDVHDDDVQMAPAPSLNLHDGSKIVPYLYSSPYWGNRLVAIIPRGNASTTFEFAAESKEELTKLRGIIKGVVGSFRYLDPTASTTRRTIRSIQRR